LTPSVSAFAFSHDRPISAAAPVSASTTPAPFVEPASASAAVAAFLSAERDGDTATGFRLLTTGDRDAAGSSEAWAASQAERPRPIAVQVTSERGALGDPGVDVAVVVTRQPALDPFTGFVSARADQMWRALQENGAWRVRAEPVEDDPVLPPVDAATTPVATWVRALASCDLAGAARLQGGLQLYGSFDLVGTPCRERGAWTAGEPVGVDSAPDVQPLIEAYGPDVPSWTRLVPVQGPHTRFFVAVAPVGDDWRVIGVTPSNP